MSVCIGKDGILPGRSACDGMNRTRYSSCDSAIAEQEWGHLGLRMSRDENCCFPGKTHLSASTITTRTCDFPEKIEPNFLILRSSQYRYGCNGYRLTKAVQAAGMPIVHGCKRLRLGMISEARIGANSEVSHGISWVVRCAD